MADFVFKRYEFKYILTLEQYFALKTEITKRLCPDPFGAATVQSLYYDTEDYRLVRASIEKPVFKEKLRLRCYNLNDNDKDVFLEMKRKYDGVVYKRRVACKEDEAKKILEGGGQNSQIGRELAYFYKFYGDLSPKMLILYDREAFFEKGGDLRATFDRNARYRTADLDFRTSLDGENILPSGTILAELKTATAFPLWLCKLLCKEGIVKQSFSKYGEAYKREYLKNETRSETICSNRFLRTEPSLPSVSL